MATEFKRAQTDLERALHALDQLSKQAEVASTELNKLQSTVDSLVEDATAFQKKRSETIEEDDPSAPGGKRAVPRYYGPKMAEKVVAFEEQVERLKASFDRFKTMVKVVHVETSKAVINDNQREQQESTIPIVQPSTGLQVVRESDADLARRRQQEEQQNAKLALGALGKVAESLKQAEDSDPLVIEMRIFDGLIYSAGLDGFRDAIHRVDAVKNVKHIAAILEVITKHPESTQYRTLSLGNASVRELLEGNGVKECFASVGFRPQLVTDSKTQEQNVAYFLREPSVETDFEAWSTWFDTLKAAMEVAKANGN